LLRHRALEIDKFEFLPWLGYWEIWLTLEFLQWLVIWSLKTI
jgi:hypothetical protein